jgi:hypothetical protein
LRHAKSLALLLLITLAFMTLGTAFAKGRPLKVVLVQNLEFGIVGASTISGTVTIQPSGAKIVSAGLLDLGGVSVPAIFEVQGEKNRNFLITLPTSASITLPGGPTVTLTDFQANPSISGTLDQQGKATVVVGATMNVEPHHWEGDYTGPFDLIVTYQ